MPTLNKTKDETKIVLKWGGISLLIIFLVLTGIRLAAILKESFAPPPPPQASFGKLPAIPFTNQQKVNISYSIDTLSGVLPNFGDRASVYKITSALPTLLSLNKTQEKVAQVGFGSKSTQIAEDVYQWSDLGTSLQRRLTINIFSSDFTLSSAYLATPSLQNFNNLDEENSAIDLAKSFVSNMSLPSDDIDSSKTTSTLYSIDKGSLIPTSKIENAKIVRVDFFQKDLSKLPIYYEKGTISTLDLLIGRDSDQLKIVEAHYFHKNISQTSSTYAIKSTNEAFLELKQGKAYIASNPQSLIEIPIKNVVLGYYIGESQQDFLMPIIIFIGDNDFLAYVSAVKDEWLSN